jgi:hypothetical protein
VSLAGYNLIACVGLAGLSLYPTHDEKV